MYHTNEYEISLFDMTDDQLLEETKNMIFLSSRYQSARDSDFHSKVDYCYDECAKRDTQIYRDAYQLAF